MRSLVLVVACAACSSEREPGAPPTVPAAGSARTADAAPPVATIPTGPLPVTLPRLHPARAVPVQTASTFVVVNNAGELAFGKLAPGAAPYRGASSDLRGLFEAMETLEGRRPREVPPPYITHPSAPDRTTFRHTRGTLAAAPALDTLVLADADARAHATGHVIAGLHHRHVALAVTGPARLGYVFATEQVLRAPNDVRLRLTEERLYSHTSEPSDGHAPWSEADAMIAAFVTHVRPLLDERSVFVVEIDYTATTQQLVTVLAALEASGITTVDLSLATGTSVSFGVGAPRFEVVPTVKLDVRTSVAASRAVVRRQIRRASQRIMFCYEQRVAADPTLAGRVTATLAIPATGGVGERVRAEGLHPQVDACIAHVLGGIEHVAPAHGATDVTVTMTFSPPR